MDIRDHSITPSDPQARISKSEFKTLLDQIFCTVRRRGGSGVVDGVEESDLSRVEPFKSWIAEWGDEPLPDDCY